MDRSTDRPTDRIWILKNVICTSLNYRGVIWHIHLTDCQSQSEFFMWLVTAVEISESTKVNKSRENGTIIIKVEKICRNEMSLKADLRLIKTG